MLDLFLRLIDRCIDLAKHRDNTKKRLYLDFVGPAFADFEAVHQNYMETFLRYRELLRDSNKSKLNINHPVLDLISQDSLFSDNLRSKLFELVGVESTSPCRQFISAITVYLNCAASDPLCIDIPDGTKRSENLKRILTGAAIERKIVLMGISCVPRYTLREYLRGILSKPWKGETKRKSAIEALDDLVVRVQYNYSKVIREHNALRKKLLKIG